MTPKEVLIAAKACIANKADWFGGDEPRVANRVQHCLLTAIWVAADNFGDDGWWKAVQAVDAAIPKSKRVFPETCTNITAYNDTHTHKACMRVMSRAIASAS